MFKLKVSRTEEKKTPYTIVYIEEILFILAKAEKIPIKSTIFRPSIFMLYQSACSVEWTFFSR